MKRFGVKILLVAFFAFMPMLLPAQSDSRIYMLKQRAKEMVGQLNNYITYMANPKNSIKNRFAYKNIAQGLFLNDCKPYDEIIEYKDGHKETIKREGVTMEVVSLRNPVPRKKPMPEYFRGIINLGKVYSSVSVEATDIVDMTVSELQPYGDGLYVCTVYFDQKFIGRKLEKGTYMDITRKWAVVYIEVQQTVGDDGQTEEEYIVRLGDIHADSIKKITG